MAEVLFVDKEGQTGPWEYKTFGYRKSLTISLPNFSEATNVINILHNGGSVMIEAMNDLTVAADGGQFIRTEFLSTYIGDPAPTHDPIDMTIPNAINIHKGEVWMLTTDHKYGNITMKYVAALWSGSITKDNKYAYALEKDGKNIKSIVKEGKVITMGKYPFSTPDQFPYVHEVDMIPNGPSHYIKDEQKDLDTSIQPRSSRVRDVWVRIGINDGPIVTYQLSTTDKQWNWGSDGFDTIELKYSQKTVFSKEIVIKIYMFSEATITYFHAYAGWI